MTWMLVLQAVETFAVVVGVVFGLIQLRQLRSREIQEGIELLHTLPHMAEAALLLHDLPDNLSGEELRSRLGEKFASVVDLLAVLESLGPLVARGQVPIEMFAEYYRGATILSWKKVRRYIAEEREAGWPNLFEWVQWLAERMEERSALAQNAPAFERFKDWKASTDYARLSAAASRREDEGG
jgi:hypothetical protein